ncbi:hypothetical protein N7532_009659 [Penicillium argentinense]|uniref:Amidase domain-containing protein n=1 Tax=Penicillium argentinense TaxID=1131581 RepID=A0A9W9K330_9EURO|nr:uncharacterized protein N7532_009659 [Penicillium argentinense]KAJ5090975.1 hypothetical protein N7532_009659 [Penicillium argentinense]
MAVCIGLRLQKKGLVVRNAERTKRQGISDRPNTYLGIVRCTSSKRKIPSRPAQAFLTLGNRTSNKTENHFYPGALFSSFMPSSWAVCTTATFAAAVVLLLSLRHNNGSAPLLRDSSFHPIMTIKLENTSIIELLRGLDHNRFSVVDLVEAYINRIEHLNPKVRAVTQINPDALSIARGKDAEREKGKPSGKLHGIPILVKDLFLTTDRLMSTNGCSGLTSAIPKYEATVIRRLRDEGAVLLGKTVPTQWANYRNPGKASGGWSAVGGQCLAAYHEDQDPSGSSSGSAVAVSLGLATAALGTETSGSLSSPAQRSAVISIKPTVGLTSRYGVYSVSEWQDTVGVLSQNVRDGAQLLSVIAGSDPQDAFTISDPRDPTDFQKPPPNTDYTEACVPDGLEGRRIAIPRHLFPPDKVVNAAFDKALEILRSLGATIIDDVHFSEFDKNFTYSDELGWTLGIRVAIREKEECEKWGVDEWLKCEELGQQYGPQSEQFKRSLAWRQHIGQQIHELLERTQSDLIFVPSTVDTSANVGGCPTVGVPLGFYPADTPVSRRKSSGLVTVGPNVPFGALFVGRRWDDYTLISAAFAYEQASHIRQKIRPVIHSDIQLPDRGLADNAFPQNLLFILSTMSIQTTLNYLTPLQQWDEVKPYELTGRVAPDRRRNNFDFTSHTANVRNVRSNVGAFTLDTTGFEWTHHSTVEDLKTDESVTRHILEVEEFIREHLEAEFVKAFQYQIRKRTPDSVDPRVRPPSNFVHVDLVESDYIYPNFVSESLLVKYSPCHRWHYLSDQGEDELLIITNFDSKSGRCVPHSGFELPYLSEKVRPRESIEIKVVVWNKI